MDGISAILINALAPVAGILVTSLVSWLSYEATKYVRMRTRNVAANDAMKHICHSVETIVGDLNQTMVPAVQAASKDGKLSASDGAKIKQLAFQRIGAQVPVQIQAAAGFFASSVPDLISSKIEKAVFDLKVVKK